MNHLQVLEFEIDQWNAAAPTVLVPEAELIQLLNRRLETFQHELNCKVIALRYLPTGTKNWNVARFQLGPCQPEELPQRFETIARIVVAAGDGYNVA